MDYGLGSDLNMMINFYVPRALMVLSAAAFIGLSIYWAWKGRK